uniref:Uncharacterized protein n=1 Tax=Salix viminalis TaxID=40686 RepID=A0A6N2K6X7_SALVM
MEEWKSRLFIEILNPQMFFWIRTLNRSFLISGLLEKDRREIELMYPLRWLVHMVMLLLNMLKQAISPFTVMYGASAWFSMKSLLAGERWKEIAL